MKQNKPEVTTKRPKRLELQKNEKELLQTIWTYSLSNGEVDTWLKFIKRGLI
jgi:hypothetical protein